MISHNQSGWGWPLKWSGFRAEQDVSGRWFFRGIKNKIVCAKFSYVQVASEKGYSYPKMEFYISGREGQYDYFGYIDKHNVEAELRDLMVDRGLLKYR